METLENGFFTWMWKDDDGLGYDQENLEEIEKEHGLKITRWKCIWDKNAGTNYTYYSWVTWESEDGRYGYDSIYMNAYHDEECIDVQHFGLFSSKEEFQKEFDKVISDHKEFQEFMEIQKQKQKDTQEAYLWYLNSKGSTK